MLVAFASCCSVLRDARSQVCSSRAGQNRAEGFVLGGGANDEGAKNRKMALRLLGPSRCTWTVTTAKDGTFVVDGLPAGDYEMWPVGSNCHQRAERFRVRDGQTSFPV